MTANIYKSIYTRLQHINIYKHLQMTANIYTRLGHINISIYTRLQTFTKALHYLQKNFRGTNQHEMVIINEQWRFRQACASAESSSNTQRI